MGQHTVLSASPFQGLLTPPKMGKRRHRNPDAKPRAECAAIKAQNAVLAMPAYPATWRLADLMNASGLEYYYARKAVWRVSQRGLLTVLLKGVNSRPAVYQLKP